MGAIRPRHLSSATGGMTAFPVPIRQSAGTMLRLFTGALRAAKIMIYDKLRMRSGDDLTRQSLIALMPG